MFPSKFPRQQKQAKEQRENQNHKRWNRTFSNVWKAGEKRDKRFYKNITNDFKLKQMRNSWNPKHGCTATSYLQLDYDDKMNPSTNSLMNIFDT